jgi:hypothetical protein
MCRVQYLVISVNCGIGGIYNTLCHHISIISWECILVAGWNIRREHRASDICKKVFISNPDAGLGVK